MKTLITLKTLIFLIVTLSFSLTYAQVGIGTTTPAYTFEVVNTGDIGATALAGSTNSGVDGVSLSGYNTSTVNGYNGIEGITAYSGTTFSPAGVLGLAIYGGPGNSATIGVFGTTNERQGTGVIGSRFDSGGPDTGWGGQFYNDLGYTGFFGAISDERTKKNIIEINDALSIVNELNPVTYFYDFEKYPNMGLNTEMEYGFIAQEVREVLPEIVREKNLNTNATAETKSKQGLKNTNEQFVVMDYTRIIPILTKAIKEQQSIIDTQNSKIQDLETKLLLLESKVNTLIENQD